jgi:hypothetical protein
MPQTRSYEVSHNQPQIAPPVVSSLSNSTFFPYYVFESWENYEAFADIKPPCFRWLGQHMAILMGSEQAAAGRRKHLHCHRHLV